MEEATALVVVLEDAEEEEAEVKSNGLLWSRLLRR
jgi:hypothetical protein